ncbi:riboflavin synthase [[Clostridium] dakarense]|uniref:riboflavin synthase n=1 Tax=Faecalimicrobium dakarense TaxID=1301100 RepID=UPI0004B23FB1|nr:riboflavin synthase [[Clostridium] dakarense]
MFTGIVEEIGTIVGIKNGEKSSRLNIKSKKILENTNLGDSICTNGVCLTVANINSSTFEADVMSETLNKSNLGLLKIGSKVNLERALRVNDRLGGHIVSGHIDGIGQIVSVTKDDNAVWIAIKAQENILEYIIYKGSVSIDGISLTVAYVDDSLFKVSIIPHTGENTILLNKNIGETVNLECDLIGKYVEKLLGLVPKNQKSKEDLISIDFLKENGFYI